MRNEEKPKSKMARTGISIPMEIWERMDKFKGQINWSAVWSNAIERKLQELEKKK